MQKSIKYLVFSLSLSLGLLGQNQINTVEFWFNQNYQTRSTQTFAATLGYSFTDSLNVANLPNGVNSVTFRFKQSNGLWSSPATKVFVKTPAAALLTLRNIVAYDYWLNGDFSSKISVSTTPSASFVFLDSLNISVLPNGVNSVSFRFKDNSGLWSSPATKVFIKTPAAALLAQRNIVAYQYWLNGDFLNKITASTTPNASFVFLDSLNISVLPDGLNSVSFRFKDNSELWSAPATKFFVKTADAQTLYNKDIVAYQFWMNDEVQNKTTVNIADTQLFTYLDSVNVANLHNGMNTLNYRFKDADGLWTALVQRAFIKKDDPPQMATANIVAYRYWVGDDASKLHRVEIANHNPNVYVIDTADLRLSPAGNYLFNMQFLDDTGVWSSTVTDTISKNMYPFVAFTASKTTACSGETITFSYDTADVDLLVWNYGTGLPDTSFAPQISYSVTGFYTVSVTAINTDSNLTNVFTKANYIFADDGFDTLFYATICQGDSSFFDGTWVFEDSVYQHIYTGATGCDSVLRLDLTVNPNVINAISATMCDGQTYVFGSQTLATSGVYTKTFPAANTCDSIVTLTLSVNPVYTIADTANICNGDSYVLGSQVLTASGNYSETFSTAFSCDSTINLTLTVDVVDTAVTLSNFTLTALAGNATYQWLDCDAAYAQIPGETAKTFTPTKNGRFAVAITQGSCTDTSGCKLVSGIEIAEWESGQIRVYPNPSSGIFILEISNPKSIERIEIYDGNSRQLATYLAESKSTKIDLSWYADGIYFMKIVGRYNVSTVRLVKRE